MRYNFWSKLYLYMEFLNDIDRLLYQVHVVRSSLIQHSPPFFDSSHSAAVAAERELIYVVYLVYQDSECRKWHLLSIPFLFNRFQHWLSVRLQSLFIFTCKQARIGTCKTASDREIQFKQSTFHKLCLIVWPYIRRRTWHPHFQRRLIQYQF